MARQHSIAAAAPQPGLFLAHQTASTGIPKRTVTTILREIAAVRSLPVGSVCAEIIPASSWKRSKDRLTASASQTAARLAYVFELAEKVWGNRTHAAEWLSMPHPELNGASPFSLIRTESGGRTVESLLVALDQSFPL